MPRFKLDDPVVYNTGRIVFFGEVTGLTKRKYGPDKGKIFLTLENSTGQLMIADQNNCQPVDEFITVADFAIMVTHCTMEANHV